MGRLHIAHIINPVKVDKSSDLHIAQPITFESMLRAKKQAGKEIDIELLTTQYPEDREIIPAGFRILPDLERSVLDIQNFERPKKYPLIYDILKTAYSHSNAEYFIFTNVDIGLIPNFYLFAKESIQKGRDAFIINRRRIPAKYHAISDLEAIYRDEGKPHPGFDCFVFHRDIFPKICLDNICVGIPFIGVALAHNLFAFAQNFKLYDKEHLTFHIGMDVLPKRDKEYYWYNRKQFENIYKNYLKKHLNTRKMPYGHLPFLQRYWKWGMNPSLFVFKNFRLEWKHLFER